MKDVFPRSICGYALAGDNRRASPCQASNTTDAFPARLMRWLAEGPYLWISMRYQAGHSQGTSTDHLISQRVAQQYETPMGIWAGLVSSDPICRSSWATGSVGHLKSADSRARGRMTAHPHWV